MNSNRNSTEMAALLVCRPPYQPPNPLEMPLHSVLQASLAAVRRLFLLPLPLPLPRFLQGAAAALGERQ